MAVYDSDQYSYDSYGSGSGYDYGSDYGSGYSGYYGDYGTTYGGYDAGMTAFSGFMTVLFWSMLIVNIAMYIYSAIFTYQLFKRSGSRHPAAAWVPVWNTWEFLALTGRSGALSLLVLVPFVGPLIVAILLTIASRWYADRAGKTSSPGGWQVLYFFASFIWLPLIVSALGRRGGFSGPDTTQWPGTVPGQPGGAPEYPPVVPAGGAYPGNAASLAYQAPVAPASQPVYQPSVAGAPGVPTAPVRPAAPVTPVAGRHAEVGAQPAQSDVLNGQTAPVRVPPVQAVSSTQSIPPRRRSFGSDE